jgi:hypothetical protein
VSVTLDPATAELVRLGALLEVVSQAVALQDRAEAVIVGCAQPGETSWEVARTGRAVAAQYGRLSGWAADLVWPTDRPPPPQRAVDLLRYHLGMLDCELRDLETALRTRLTTLPP